MRRVWCWCGLLAVQVAAARPIVVILAPDEPFAGRAEALGQALLDSGGVMDDDLWTVADGDAFVDLLERRPGLRATDSDRLLLVLGGEFARDTDGGPLLLSRRDRVPLGVILGLLADQPVGAWSIIAALNTGRGAKPLAPLESWPAGAQPAAMLVGDGAGLLDRVTAGTRYLTADTDADGVIDDAELRTFVTREPRPPRVGTGRSPEQSGPVAMIGLGGPDTLPPLVLVLLPRLPNEGPVLLEAAGPLRVRGLIGDDRRPGTVQVNGQAANLQPAEGSTPADLGFPGRMLAFETTVPLAEAGYTTIEVVATDAAGNVTRESFQALVGQPGDLPLPVEAGGDPAGASRIDAVRFEWGVTEDWRYGFKVIVDATVRGRLNRPCRVAVRFRFPDGRFVGDFNGQYADAAGRAVAIADFVPQFDDSLVRDLAVFVPQRELHLAAGRAHALEALVTLLDGGGDPPEILAVSGALPLELTEPAQAATVTGFDIEHNQREGTIRGLRLTPRFHVAGLKDSPVQIAIYFQRADGRPLLDANGRYRAGDGAVAVFRDVVPGFDSAEFKSIRLFLPYDELDLREPGQYALRARAVVWDKRGRRALDASAWRHFSVTQR